MRLGLPNFQLFGKCPRGSTPRWQKRWRLGGRILLGAGGYSLGEAATSPTVHLRPKSVTGMVDFGHPTFWQPLFPRYRIDVGKGEILIPGFRNSQLHGIYLCGGAPRWQTSRIRGEMILAGIGCNSFGEAGTSALYIYGANRLLGRSISGIRLSGEPRLPPKL